jgi:methylase of polypeptide subunit release factors
MITFKGIQLETNDVSFRPTLITEACAEVVNFKDKKILDLGCGIGPLAIYFALNGAKEVTASDIYEEHLNLTLVNAKKNEANIKIIQSDLFRNISEQYNVISCDVSGVEKKIAEVTGWFPDGVPKADDTGANLIIKVIQDSSSYLAKDGELFICATSFSDIVEIEKTMEENYKNSWKRVHCEEVPFSKRLKRNLDLLSFNDYIIEKDDSFFWQIFIYKLKKIN